MGGSHFTVLGPRRRAGDFLGSQSGGAEHPPPHGKARGVAMEIFGQSTSYLLGYGFIYTNKNTLSIGTGALLSDL